MKIREIIHTLAAFAPPSLQEGYDNAGLIFGHPDWELTNVLLTLDATEAVMLEAIEKGCNLVVAHHPIVFGGLKKINGSNYVERVAILAIKHDIAVYAAHTNLDNVLAGVNARMAEQLDLQNCRILAPKPALLKKLYTFVPVAHLETVRAAVFAAGAGHIGHYSECSFQGEGQGTFRGDASTHPFAGQPGSRHTEAEAKLEVVLPRYLEGAVVKALLEAHPYEEVAYDLVALDNTWEGAGAGMVGTLATPMEEQAFLLWVKQQFRTGCVRHTPLLGRPIQTVALCGGAGSFLLKQAIAAGADAYISADFKYHEFFDADNQLIIADIGHFESEQFTVELFYHILTQKFRNFAPLKSSIRTNPVNYL
ncbi:dinuclear metal center protein, YbgI/SA1388 family [Chitinophaga costaii]|uniref:GTP cyclohydrolase 1 type 2 homolog n=1 Tax=Chitinophaga costaii TaxID=1335309 RepID=A0A1C4BZV6_9BACT|nr:Nif3-like dinuclear metal center hexameric protein [Chitinophaga costaii]PUZ27397.1 Nif3-like dinuclear metal center hexameric protein [Chitinophaga costaii]SCC12456.1 dinuclear metal center protein, YbgI/SA1388 family [Chitinophaga costaii]